MSTSIAAISEPAPGSIVLLEGETGTAYQRLHSTGRWHSVIQGSGVSYSWEELLRRTERPGAKPVLIVHEVDESGVVLNARSRSSEAQVVAALALVESLRADTVRGATYLAEAAAALREYRRLYT